MPALELAAGQKSKLSKNAPIDRVRGTQNSKSGRESIRVTVLFRVSTFTTRAESSEFECPPPAPTPPRHASHVLPHTQAGYDSVNNSTTPFQSGEWMLASVEQRSDAAGLSCQGWHSVTPPRAEEHFMPTDVSLQGVAPKRSHCGRNWKVRCGNGFPCRTAILHLPLSGFSTAAAYASKTW